jgi:hypothetical protein
MPASHTVEAFDGLKFTVEPVTDPDPVYFTDQAPEFRVRVENDGATHDFAEESQFIWDIEVEGWTEDTLHSGEGTFGPLDDGETEEVIIGGEVLAYEGHGVLGIGAGNARGTDGDRWRLNTTNRRATEPAYTFSVYDEYHYEEAIERPRKLQYAIIFTSIVLILFSFLQIALAVI